MNARTVAIAAVAGGFAGWAFENVYAHVRGDPARFPSVFGEGNRVPFLPIYAVGGALIALSLPILTKYTWPLRGAAYAIGFTALEYGAAALERSGGRASWAYEGGAPVDVPHALVWGVLGLVAERAVRRIAT